MKRYIQSDDHAISMTARIWHYEDWEKAETTLSSIVHLRVNFSDEMFISMLSPAQYQDPLLKIPPVILSMLGFVQLNISLTYLPEEQMLHLIKSTDDIKLGGVADIANDRVKI